jgi:transposase-like protein
VGARRAVLRVSPRCPTADLHDERAGKRARTASQIIKTRGQFPTDDAATKPIWLALRNITAKWARSLPYWRPAMNQFAILYEGRFSPTTT